MMEYTSPTCQVVALGVSETILQGSPLAFGNPGGAGGSQGFNEYDGDF